MIIRFYSVTGQSDELENELKSLVTAIKGELAKRNISEDKVRLTTIKVRSDVVSEVMRYVNEPEDRVPGQYRPLIIRMRQDGVNAFPALVINDRKIAEGGEVTADVIRKSLYEAIESEFGFSLVEKPKAPEAQPTQIQQAPAPVQPTGAVPQPPQPLVPIQQPTQQPPPVVQPPLPTQPRPEAQVQLIPTAPPAPAGVSFKLVSGRPDNCLYCAYYGRNRRFCYLYGIPVDDPARPPCKFAQ